MHMDDIKILECIECGGNLILEPHEAEKGIIRLGILECGSCGRTYPIVDEVGIFFRKALLPYYLNEHEKVSMNKMGMRLDFDDTPARLERDKERQLLVSRNWEYQWEEVLAFDASTLNRDPEDLFGSAVFWRFIPLASEKIKGKTVYIACGGRGREAYHIIKKEPSKIIINEIGSEIYSILKLIPEWRERLLLLRCDVCYSPLKSGAADITICDHALQHVLDHKLGFSRLVKATKPGGLISICVYSRENNFVMTGIIEPLKHILHKFPLSAQRTISLLPAVAIYLLIRLFYLPLYRISRNAAARLPLCEHMIFWSHNDFKTTWLSCFDLIHAPISYHFRESELRQMSAENNLEVVWLINTHKTLWSLVALKKYPS